MNDITWDTEAEVALAKVPIFVRKKVRQKVTERVAEKGGSNVTLADFMDAENTHRSETGGKRSEKQLNQMMPKENKPGAEVVIVESCHNEVNNCPHVLIKTSQWKDAVEGWILENDIHERLRVKIRGSKILFHHKLKISISGCPNACSRPQIADIGIVGYVKPLVDPDDCTVCGACEKVCKDRAITVNEAAPVFDRKACLGCTLCRDICPNDCIRLSEPAVRILAGGKLGRHPHLANVVGTADTPEQMIHLIDRLAIDYIENAREGGERFADFRLRIRKEAEGKRKKEVEEKMKTGGGGAHEETTA